MGHFNRRDQEEGCPMPYLRWPDSTNAYYMRNGKEFCSTLYVTLSQLVQVVGNDIRRQARYARQRRKNSRVQH